MGKKKKKILKLENLTRFLCPALPAFPTFPPEGAPWP